MAPAEVLAQVAIDVAHGSAMKVWSEKVASHVAKYVAAADGWVVAVKAADWEDGQVVGGESRNDLGIGLDHHQMALKLYSSNVQLPRSHSLRAHDRASQEIDRSNAVNRV